MFGISWWTGIGRGTLKAANGVNARGSSATTSVVCYTLVDVYISLIKL